MRRTISFGPSPSKRGKLLLVSDSSLPLYRELVWVDRLGRAWAIDEMTDAHISGVMQYLLKHAETLQSREMSSLMSYIPQGEMALDEWDRMFDRLCDQTPWAWVRETPIFIALRGELEKRHPRPTDRAGYG